MVTNRPRNPRPERTEEGRGAPSLGTAPLEAMDEFLKACGISGPLELTVENRGLSAMRWSAPQPFALIGRDPTADLTLDHPRVDGYHAFLQVIEGAVYWVDLGSQTGTRGENGMARSGWLDHPHGIGIGPYVIKRASGDRAGTAAPVDLVLAAPPAVRPDPFASRPPDSDDLPRVFLEFRRDAAKPIRWRMRHILTLVGTSPQCKVRLAAPGVEPFHCSLLRTNAGVWVVNLLGQRGLTLNGASIRAARLEDGDELKIGDILVRALFKAPEAAEGENGSTDSEATRRADLLARTTTVSRELATSRPKPNWTPAREATRLIAEQLPEGEISASTLAAVLDQFGQMQQQFLDQFQQTTLMMFRALGTMHRDQMEELREKFDSLHQLGENLQSLQSHMATNAATGPGPTAREGTDPTPSPPASAPAPAPTGTPEGRAGHPGQGGSSATVTAAEVEATEQLRAKMRAMIDQPNGPSPNVHEWLIGRLATLEEEQRTRWQRLLDLVRGR